MICDATVMAWKDKRVFVLGDIMLDRFVRGRVDRVSPEAPIPVLHFESEIAMLGGAGNVARNIVALGGAVILSGVLGRDAPGESIAHTSATNDGIEAYFLHVEEHATTVKTRYTSGGQQIMRLDVEQKLSLSCQQMDEILQIFKTNVDRVHAVVLSDYAKGVLCPDLVRQVISIATARNLPIVVDPKGVEMQCYAGATVLTPNVVEASLVTHLDCEMESNAEQAAKLLCNIARVEAVVLTRGAKGMVIHVAADASNTRLPAEAREVFDVSGAGDTVVATLALALATGRDVPTSARLANVAAGIVVGKLGTAVVWARELALALSAPGGVDPKIAESDQAVNVVAAWRRNGLRVGFTNGCFDLLHPGHVELLKRSRAECDRLVVALNSDASVRRLKGEMRPVQNERARAIVISSLNYVDLVTVFDDDTPLRLIEDIKPDCLIKGADYSIENVVGSNFVLAYGGKVILVPLEPGQSTTRLIGRAKVGVAP